MAAPGNLFSPSRLQIKPGTGSNCLGRMITEHFGSAIGAGLWLVEGRKSTAQSNTDASVLSAPIRTPARRATTKRAARVIRSPTVQTRASAIGGA